jgi:hypothetical protein
MSTDVLIHVGAMVAYIILGALVGVEWLARRSMVRFNSDNVVYAFFVGFLWPIALLAAAVVWWYEYRTYRLAARRGDPQ